MVKEKFLDLLDLLHKLLGSTLGCDNPPYKFGCHVSTAALHTGPDYQQ